MERIIIGRQGSRQLTLTRSQFRSPPMLLIASACMLMCFVRIRQMGVLSDVNTILQTAILHLQLAEYLSSDGLCGGCSPAAVVTRSGSYVSTLGRSSSSRL